MAVLQHRLPSERMRATQIADEGVEIVRNLRDNAFVNLNRWNLRACTKWGAMVAFRFI
jgi:hypothetical protein